MESPGPDHPIRVAPARRRVTVALDGVTIAESDAALELKEARYPPVYYFPRGDVRMDLLAPSGHKTHCPYKGCARHFHVHAAGRIVGDAVWSYETPYPALAEIAMRLAFYPDRVAITVHDG